VLRAVGRRPKIVPLYTHPGGLGDRWRLFGAAIVATALLDAGVLPEFSSFGIALAEAWIAHFPDDTEFWIDNGNGKR
jgi:hypothetical protein